MSSAVAPPMDAGGLLRSDPSSTCIIDHTLVAPGGTAAKVHAI